jgi:hypothetical protein
MKTELENIEQMNPAKLFTPKGIGPLLKAIEIEATAEIPDVESKMGRDRITSLAYKVARSKTTIDDLGKSHVSDLKFQVAAIDDVRKTARDFLDDLKVKVRKPLTDWEEAEASRVEKLTDKVNRIRDLGNEFDDAGNNLDSGTLKVNLQNLRDMKITKAFAEYQDDAVNAKNEAIVTLLDAIPKQETAEREAEDARIQEEQAAEELRIEQEQRIAREAVEAADLQAKRELEARDWMEAQAKADQEARERNTRHKGQVNKAAAAGIQEVLTFITDDDAKTLVKAIVMGKIPNVTITY